LVSDGLLNVAESAVFLRLSRSAVYALMERGELQYVKLGRARRIPRRALEQLAASNMQGGWATSHGTARG
jgi:excisionase family DNA binding protein